MNEMVTFIGEIISREEAKARGLKRYFLGAPCTKHGHISERYVLNRFCCACSAIKRDPSYMKKYRAMNKEKLKKQIAEWRKINPEKVKEWTRTSYVRGLQKNPGRNRQKYLRTNQKIEQEKRNERNRRRLMALEIVRRLGITL